MVHITVLEATSYDRTVKILPRAEYRIVDTGTNCFGNTHAFDRSSRTTARELFATIVIQELRTGNDLDLYLGRLRIPD